MIWQLHGNHIKCQYMKVKCSSVYCVIIRYYDTVLRFVCYKIRNASFIEIKPLCPRSGIISAIQNNRSSANATFVDLLVHRCTYLMLSFIGTCMQSTFLTNTELRQHQ